MQIQNEGWQTVLFKYLRKKKERGNKTNNNKKERKELINMYTCVHASVNICVPAHMTMPVSVSLAIL